MHQTRQQLSTKLPIKRKGTKYIAKARVNPDNAVSLVSAVRDMLQLAKTAKEVKEMIKAKSLKINGKVVYDANASIQLFNILEAGKQYQLSMLPTGRFVFEHPIMKDTKLCKVISRRLVSGGDIQYNMNDGSNAISKDKIAVGDSLYIDFSGKIKKHVAIEKGRECFILSGKYLGMKCKIHSIEGNKISVKLEDKDKEEAVLDNKQLMAI